MVVLKVIKAKNVKEKVVGLIGKKSPMSFFLKTRFGIHTFGVKFSIDVLILDGDYKVKYFKENLSPKSFFFWNPLYDNVVELPAGEIKRKKITKKDMIRLICR